MNRAELEKLDRDALVAQAEAAGVTRPRLLTRPELVDELLLRGAGDAAAKERARGLFGVARDLLARVIERGLHLPDAAERIRTLGAPPPPRQSAPAALPTVTLAEIYAAQGHRKRALETLESLLSREPDHRAAAALLAQLRDAAFPVPAPHLPPEEDDVPNGEGAPACVAVPVDPTTLHVHWEVDDAALCEARGASDKGTLTLRVITVIPTWDGPLATVRDHGAGAPLGDLRIRGLPAPAIVRAAIGWKTARGFTSFAHSAAIETPRSAASQSLPGRSS